MKEFQNNKKFDKDDSQFQEFKKLYKIIIKNKKLKI